ncbi:hypothetical protein E3E26_05315 [Thermococcus sp. LS1]|uniref:hypothetical protein n=1 Tax=Thermococcus sp. LS1 TaxID=1638259 RepID=UPI00143BB550|nr:hypothetical protein [Thermococcus sp. LS1]NJD99199.1 hypothetical protein [Thermococcus sp. LS1]
MKHPPAALIAVILLGLVVRLVLAPYSAGSDLAQFYGFAGTMLEYKACFYAYADSISYIGKGWPYPWPYVYGPVLAYLLALIRSIVGGSVEAFWSGETYYVYVDPAWAFSVKLVFIAADTLAVVTLYLLLRGRGEKVAVLGTALYYLNPITIYVSAVYGMFDQLALLFFLIGLYLSTRREKLPYALYGFTLTVKHTLLFPVLVSLWDALLDGKSGVKRLAPFFFGALIPFLPMLLLCPSSIWSLPELLRGMNVCYTLPISYSLNGVSSLATYLHQTRGIDTLVFLERWYIPAALLFALVFLRHAFERDLFVSTSLAYIVFVATFWRVNPQYLAPLVAFLVIITFRGRGFLSALALGTVVYAGFWPIMQPTSFWFHVHLKNPNWGMVALIDRLTLRIFSDGAYVAYSLGLTALLYTIILTSTVPYLKNLKAWLSEKGWVRA